MTASADRFLKACRREPVDCTPVWFMRQAGRYLAEYRALRQRYSLLTLCKTPELAAQVTLQPLRRLPVDAAIIFTDLLVPVEPMGLKLDFAEGAGPVIQNPVRHLSDVEALERRYLGEKGPAPLSEFMKLGKGTCRHMHLLAHRGFRLMGLNARYASSHGEGYTVVRLTCGVYLAKSSR